MSNISDKVAMVVAGARPNFMKIAPILQEMDRVGLTNVLIHTGQHYDSKMSDDFFEELQIKMPDFNLNVGSDSHARQTAKIMELFEPIITQSMPDILVVVGDVNSTLATALVASKIGVKIAHVEAGLRSFDRAMPEEINRIVVDHISEKLFATSPDALINLRNEGIDDKAEMVGNVMVDTLLNNINRALERPITHSIEKGNFGLVTLHRPSNVDNPNILGEIISALNVISQSLNILFPCHPRTRKQLNNFQLSDAITIIEPVSYMDCIALEANSKLVLTDSGGIQEETTVLGIPCLTLRETTERPITVTNGTNFIVGTKKDNILATFEQVMNKPRLQAKLPEFWDGKASQRIVSSILRSL
jgi:UDP-N-acetylglucosamine 2-epimerase (non-hydrolysing)